MLHWTMTLQPIQSSNLRAIGYDMARSVLTVQFSTGWTYEYFDVPRSLHSKLVAAQPHPWTKHGREVKAYRYVSIA